jgi:hypothetical protein
MKTREELVKELEDARAAKVATAYAVFYATDKTEDEAEDEYDAAKAALVAYDKENT